MQAPNNTSSQIVMPSNEPSEAVADLLTGYQLLLIQTEWLGSLPTPPSTVSPPNPSDT